MLVTIDIDSIHGDQRSIHLQLTNNKRRIKRGSKQRKESTKKVIDRAIHIFNTGTLNDYTHPKEIDPYWAILYKQYEFLVYIEIFYKSSIKKCNSFLTDDDIMTIIYDLEMVKQQKKMLLVYLMNFMNIMYGSVIQRRFYGWKYYIEDFVSKFNEVAIMNLTKLKFDVDQTRCSVYFYQAFWLSGLSITNRISDDLKKNESDSSKSTSNVYNLEDDFDTMYDVHGSDMIDDYNTIELGTSTVIVEEEPILEIDIVEEVILPSTEEKLEEATEVVAIDRYVHMDAAQIVEDVDFNVFCTLKKLLHQLGINHKELHSFTDKKLSKLGRIIRKKIVSGELTLHETDKQSLLMLFRSPLLN